MSVRGRLTLDAATLFQVCCLLLVEFIASLADFSLWELTLQPWPLLALGQWMQPQLEEHTYSPVWIFVVVCKSVNSLF